MAAQLTRVPDPLDTVRDDVPPALAAVIMRCLEKLPENRPQIGECAARRAGWRRDTAPAARLRQVSRPREASGTEVARPATCGDCGCAARGPRRRRGGRDEHANRRRPAAVKSVIVTPCNRRRRLRPQPQLRLTAAAGSRYRRERWPIPPRALPIVLTRAESLAIADAIRKRVTARRDSQVAKGERALADSLSRRFEQALSDSLMRIIAALRGGRRIEGPGFDPKEHRALPEMAKMSAADA